MAQPPYQPSLPFARGSDTSREAAESMRAAAVIQRARVLRAIRAAGDRGMTTDEVEVALGGKHQSISARVNELWRSRAITRGDDSRLTRGNRRAHVYRAAPANDNEVAP